MKTLPLLLVVAALVGCSDRQPNAGASAPVDSADVVDAEPSAPPSTTGTGIDTAAGPAAVAAPDDARVEADYLGRWTGVEGMYLVVAAKPGGGVTLDMQWDLDNSGTFDGSVTAEGLRFMRNGVAETALPGNGDATGLKHLADKQECLVVKPGEGYCRD